MSLFFTSTVPGSTYTPIYVQVSNRHPLSFSPHYFLDIIGDLGGTGGACPTFRFDPPTVACVVDPESLPEAEASVSGQSGTGRGGRWGVVGVFFLAGGCDPSLIAVQFSYSPDFLPLLSSLLPGECSVLGRLTGRSMFSCHQNVSRVRIYCHTDVSGKDHKCICTLLVSDVCKRTNPCGELSLNFNRSAVV